MSTNFIALIGAIPIFMNLCLAETHYIIVDGGGDQESNTHDIYKTVRSAYKDLESRGQKVKVLAKGGQWKLADHTQYRLEPWEEFDMKKGYPPIAGPVTSVMDILNGISSMKPKPGDRIVLLLEGHGTPPQTLEAPESAGYTLWGSSYTDFENLGQGLSNFAEETGTSVKILNAVCFGGGAHQISRKFRNICSASLAPYFSPTSYDPMFWQGFVRNIGVKGASFAGQALEGFHASETHSDSASLSSFDYVNFVLKKGPYENMTKNRKFERAFFQSGGRSRQLTPQYIVPTEYIKSLALPPEQILMQFYSEGNLLDLVDSKADSCFAAPLEADAKNVDRLSKILASLAPEKSSADEKHLPMSDSTGLSTIFHQAMQDLQENGERDRQVAEKFDKEYRALIAEWNAQKAKWRNSKIQSIKKWWYNTDTLRNKMHTRFRDLKGRASKELGRASFTHRILQQLGYLQEFARVATPEQKKRFRELLHCEWEPL